MTSTRSAVDNECHENAPPTKRAKIVECADKQPQVRPRVVIIVVETRLARTFLRLRDFLVLSQYNLVTSFPWYVYCIL